MTTNSQEINQKIKELFLLHKDLSESAIKRNRRKFYLAALEEHGSWERALRANGISKRKLREREKFYLYCIMSKRNKEHPGEALRPKNVLPESLKERVVQSYKTMKVLKDIVLNWNEDKILYELHIALMTGATLSNLPYTHEELHGHIVRHFGNTALAMEQYDKRFGFAASDMDATAETGGVMVVTNDDLVDMMVKMNYITGQDAEAVVKASTISEKEALAFFLKMLAEAQIEGKPVNEEMIKEKDAAMYFAIKAHYQTIQNAFQAAAASVVHVG